MGCLEFDRAGEIESLALQDQTFTDDGCEIDVEVGGIEFMWGGYDLNGTLSTSMCPAEVVNQPARLLLRCLHRP